MHKVLTDWRAILVFLFPAVLIYTIVLLVPIVWSTVYSFYHGMVGINLSFNGWKNYEKMFSDSKFIYSFWLTIKYMLVVTPGQIVAGFLLSLLLVFYVRKFSVLMRTIIFFPVILPTVAVSQLFVKIFEIAPQYGLVNSILQYINLDFLVQAWLGQSSTAFWIICITDIWKAMGFYAIVLYAGVVSIPEETLDAARIDGAHGWRLVQSIVMPLLRPILVSSIIFSLNGTIKVFDSVYAMTAGGPGYSTTTLPIYMFNVTFAYWDYGYGSAMAVVIFLQSLLLTLLIYMFARKDV